MPPELSRAVADLPFWFVIGGNAVRCFCPYRPTRDVDFGVGTAANLDEFLDRLGRRGRLEISERGPDTAHGHFEGVKFSVFVLDRLAPFVEDRRLNVTGILATKLHAILDRGARRDFFDLYVTLEHHSLGLAECFAALREVYRKEVGEALLLRALTYFADAEREAPLPGEAPADFATVKRFFLTRAGQLLVPPGSRLGIQKRVVDLNDPE
jgi:hypothetical protein